MFKPLRFIQVWWTRFPPTVSFSFFHTRLKWFCFSPSCWKYVSDLYTVGRSSMACDWHRALAQVHKCISLQIILMKSVVPGVRFFKSLFFSANLETSFKSQTSSNKNRFDLSLCILSNTSLRVFFIILFQKRGLFFQSSIRKRRMVSTDAFALWSFKSALFSLELMFLW